jgi:hypothetical protein
MLGGEEGKLLAPATGDGGGALFRLEWCEKRAALPNSGAGTRGGGDGVVISMNRLPGESHFGTNGDIAEVDKRESSSSSSSSS